MEVGLAVTPAVDATMRGRPHRSPGPRRPPLPPRLLQLLLLAVVVVVVPSANVEGGWNHIPDSALQQLRSPHLALPRDVFKFHPISTGQQLYSEDVRYATLTNVSLCTCRHRCLADLHCMGYEHEGNSSKCGITDILLPGNITEETVGEWSTGRRRGVSWLGAPCDTNSNCSLLITGAECGPENVCACRRGWTPLDEMLCRPDEHWLSSTSLTGDRLKNVEDVSLHSCQDECRDNTDCWAVEYDKESEVCWLYGPIEAEESAGELLEEVQASFKPSCWGKCYFKASCKTVEYDQESGICRLYGSAEQSVSESLPAGTTTYELRMGRWIGEPPTGYTDIAGRLFQLADEVPSKDAAEACLDLEGGAQYVPDNPKLLKRVYETLGIIVSPSERARLGIGFNDVLEENRFDTADGSALDTASFQWHTGQPSNSSDDGEEDCGGFIDQQKLNDISCNSPHEQLCEYIGPILEYNEAPVTTEDPGDDGRAFTWLTYDLGEPQQVSRVLYLAPGDAERMEVVQIRVGDQPDDRSERQSALCIHQTANMLAGGFARRFTCAVPLLGRYLHVAQRPAASGLVPRIAVFGIL